MDNGFLFGMEIFCCSIVHRTFKGSPERQTKGVLGVYYVIVCIIL